MTYNEAISRINNTLNSLKKDMRIPKRYILSILKETGKFLISQKLRDKTLFRETDLYRWVRCVELESVDSVKCPIVEFKTCGNLMRSKEKLPTLVYSRFGDSVLIVQTVDGSKTFKKTNLISYSIDKNKKHFDKFKGGFYYVDEYLYIPDSEIEVVDVLLLTMDEDYDNCSACADEKGCVPILDREFPLPDKLATVAIQEAIKEVAMRLSIPQDENSNLDSNIKTQIIQ